MVQSGTEVPLSKRNGLRKTEMVHSGQSGAFLCYFQTLRLQELYKLLNNKQQAKGGLMFLAQPI